MPEHVGGVHIESFFKVGLYLVTCVIGECGILFDGIVPLVVLELLWGVIVGGGYVHHWVIGCGVTKGWEVCDIKEGVTEGFGGVEEVVDGGYDGDGDGAKVKGFDGGEKEGADDGNDDNNERDAVKNCFSRIKIKFP